MELDSPDSDHELSVSNFETEDEVRPANATIEDLTGEADEFLNDAASLSNLSLSSGDENPVIRPRSYQKEMAESSLERNVIVAMDTGSGKTHVAVMRMLHELDRMPLHKIIWFLAPTVSLCSQQFEYIKSQIPSVQVKFLSGADGVDRWTEQSLWDAVLKNVKIVVSTYQILLDALTHGFLGMESLGLIVFDEAHNCVGKHPGAKIMLDFYHPRKSQGEVPLILGLTASPVMRSDPVSVGKIEETLHAICRTPTKHRAELLLQVKRPTLSEVFYQSLPDESNLSQYTKAIASLGQAYGSLKITEDPYVIALLKDDTEKSRRLLDKWAADYYITEVVTKFRKVANDFNGSLGGVWDVSSEEKKYLAKALQEVHINSITSQLPQAIPLISDKVRKLIDNLILEPPTFRGIVFVQERAVVSVLAHLLPVHPDTRGRFKVGTMVGLSSHAYRSRDLAEYVGAESRNDSLSDFRAGKLNLIIATSVLEEGIDVPACNVVICFQQPANLKSFIQRRGRARDRSSKLILLLESLTQPKEWRQLEKNMKDLYENDMRVLQELESLENTEEHDGRSFRVESTGALLDQDNAVAYVDLRPEFICTATEASIVRAKVILPLSVHEAVRTAESRTSWASEKNAIKDAAFEAYLALYNSGLVNKNMLPLLRHGMDVDVNELTSTKVETRASLMMVSEQLNPWIHVAQVRKEKGHVVNHAITVGQLKVNMYSPVNLPAITMFHLYWDIHTELAVKVVPDPSVYVGNFRKAPDESLFLLDAAFGSRFPIEKKRHVVLFSLDGTDPLRCQIGQHKSAEGYNFKKSGSLWTGLIRDTMQSEVRYIYSSSLTNKPPIETVQKPYENYADTPDSAHLSVQRLSRRADFLHRLNSENEKQSAKSYSVVLPTSRCTVDDVPFAYVQLGLFIPSIMHRLEVYLIADTLSKSILKNVKIKNIELVIAAISASSAGEATNYQRLEFLGDSILKLCTSIQLIAEYPLWHEGYLSAKKDRLVANSRLSRAAVEIGLDKFIISKPFTGLKWRPLYEEDLLDARQDGKRELSSKVLADVVESLVGASMVDGGMSKALTCLQVFLPELNWKPLDARRVELYDQVLDVQLPETLKSLETLLGYTFNKKGLLLEALTHASCTIGSQSLERLEFLGDSILDNIVVTAMFAHKKPELSHFQMHLLRTTLVNADFLAYICMDWSTKQEVSSIQQTDAHFEAIPTVVKLPLWRFMRHTSPHIGAIQTTTSSIFASLQPSIASAIASGTHYPWALLAKLQAQKFYSDIIESIIGAVWVDSGSLAVCTALVERMGILPYLRRILEQGVHVMHPKEQLGVLAVEKEVRYTLSLRGGVYVCEVFVGGERVCVYEQGVGKMEAQTKAAEMACAILRGRGEGVGVGGNEDEKGHLEEVRRDGDVVMDGGLRVDGSDHMDVGKDGDVVMG
ncbi:Dicer-like protein [Lachnellula suecica]|uniref:Dicer-like protein n=1 Tax=Lachnellula suecica TaxID=602035 RepID=A0A8T9BTS0_9HELO|nr:Dicer-like protein [Lachnellula suecica]